MTKVSTPRMGGGGPALKEYFPVAISDQSAALEALRYRRPDVEASELTVVGETNTDNLEWLDLQEGQILCLKSFNPWRPHGGAAADDAVKRVNWIIPVMF